MATLYPRGYQTSMVPWSEMDQRYGSDAPISPHPEYWRRLSAYLQHKNGTLGIGGAYRFTQPVKPGFAPPGMSFHEKQTFSSGLQVYSAVDLVVPVQGGVHRSPTWAEVADAPQFGLHAFISGEPWHMQCIEIRGYSTWVNAGRPDPQKFQLPGTVNPPPPPPTADYNPTKNWGLFPLDPSKPTRSNGDNDQGYPGHVRYLQDVIHFYAGGNIIRDGSFGDQTEARVTDLQRFFGLTVDGVVGSETWGTIDFLVETNAPKPPPPVDDGVWTSKGRYYVRKGDSPWRVAEIVYGDGSVGEDVFPSDAFNKYSTPTDPYFLKIPAVAGKRTRVKSGEGAYSILKRLGHDPSHLQFFYDWNGGEERVLHPEDLVFMPKVA